MAPAKKKKKPAANPARGFATVSQPSKSKALGASERSTPDNTVPTQATSPKRDHVPGDAPKLGGSPTTSATDIKEMSANELEAYLEEAELQALLDGQGSRCKSEATRQVAKLESERRQGRAQAHKMATYSWLADETVDEVIDLYNAEVNLTGKQPRPSVQGMIEDQGDQLLLNLWTLEQVLTTLRFPCTADALHHVAKQSMLGDVTDEHDSIFGLEAALQWYAVNISESELPNYEIEGGMKSEPSIGISSPKSSPGRRCLFMP